MEEEEYDAYEQSYMDSYFTINGVYYRHATTTLNFDCYLNLLYVGD